MQQQPFWKQKSLKELNEAEWESVCDRCGKCCVLKLEDVDTMEIYYTDVSCKLLDCDNCSCTDYANRKQLVPDCVTLTPDGLDALHWMPQSCAYRLLHEGKDLPDWHPLVTGEKESTHLSGNSVAGQITCELEVEDADMPDHIREW